MKMKPAAIAAAAAFTAVELEKRHSVRHDLGTVRKLAGFGRKLRRRVAKGVLVPDVWERQVDRRPNQAAIISIDDDGATTTWTFKQLDEYANKVGNFLQSQGVKPGQDVALFMENRAEFIGVWLGISKIGARVTMVNTAIKEKGLLHCLKCTNANVIIYGKELTEPFFGVREGLGHAKCWFQAANDSSGDSLDANIAKISATRPSRSLRSGIKTGDTFGYIFTSGTTGLPKAAIIGHLKLLSAMGFAHMAECKPGVDKIYTCLPLFHSAAGVIGCGFLLNGCTMVLRRKFSARSFFEDCGKHGATVVQYIGELCRYLLATPMSPHDRGHKVRVAIGNGLRPEIWKEFQQRFDIPAILEFYGATEMNGLLYNLCKTPEAMGSVGRLGTLGKMATGTVLVQYSVEADELVRDPKTGFCIKCNPGEVGQLLIRIRNDDMGKFQGYSDKKATEKKIARDVFKKGDEYFCSGDLLSCNAQGYFFFVDRIGDTFRWKGENCSTMEVSEVVSTFPGILEANVYGVLIPQNQDGRAPCAALSLSCEESQLDLDKLLVHLRRNLPSYSVPLFLRILPKMDVTATFKHQKVELRNQGIDINTIKDTMYFLGEGGSRYVKLTPELYAKVCTPFAKL